MSEELNFETLVSDTDEKILVLFTAPTWCGPCKRLEPHWEKAQQTEALSDFYFVTVDMGETPEDTGEHWATKKFGILGVPQIYLFDSASLDYKVITARAVVPLIRELLDG